MYTCMQVHVCPYNCMQIWHAGALAESSGLTVAKGSAETPEVTTPANLTAPQSPVIVTPPPKVPVVPLVTPDPISSKVSWLDMHAFCWI